MDANENLQKMYPHLELVADEPDEDVCEICKGSGFEVVPGKGARPCLCKSNGRTERLLAAAKIPARYQNCTVKDFRSGNVFSLRKARQTAIDFVTGYPAVEKGVLFIGNCGVGKTHLSVGILKGLIQKGASGLFYEFGALLKEIQNSYNPVSNTCEMKILAPVYEIEILVLDELGAVRPTAWAQEAMMNIINTRYNEKRITIFTSNYPDTRQHEREEILEDRIGARCRSRIFEMCETVLIEAEDYRKKIK